MKWGSLTMRERSDLMGLYLKKGKASLSTMKSDFSNYADGGNLGGASGEIPFTSDYSKTPSSKLNQSKIITLDNLHELAKDNPTKYKELMQRMPKSMRGKVIENAARSRYGYEDLNAGMLASSTGISGVVGTTTGMLSAHYGEKAAKGVGLSDNASKWVGVGTGVVGGILGGFKFADQDLLVRAARSAKNIPSQHGLYAPGEGSKALKEVVGRLEEPTLITALNEAVRRVENPTIRKLAERIPGVRPEFPKLFRKSKVFNTQDGSLPLKSPNQQDLVLSHNIVNFTTDRPVVSHSKGNWDSMDLAVFDESITAKLLPTFKSIEPSDTFSVLKDNINIPLSKTTFFSGHNLYPNTKPNKSLQKVWRSIINKTPTSEGGFNMHKGDYFPYNSAINKSIKSIGRPLKRDYDYLESHTGLKSGVSNISERASLIKKLDDLESGYSTFTMDDVLYPNNRSVEYKDFNLIKDTDYRSVFYDPITKAEYNYRSSLPNKK